MKPFVDHPIRLLALATALGILFVWAFYNKPIGVSVPIFVALLLIALALAGRSERVRPHAANLWLVVPIVFYAAFAALRANGFVTFLNLAALLALMALLAATYTGDALGRKTLPGIAWASFVAALHAWIDGAPVVRAAAADWRGRRSALSYLLAVLRGLLLALPILLLFGALLVSADLIFANRVETLLDQTDLQRIINQFVLAVVVSWVTLGGIVYALTRHARRLSAEQAAKIGVEERPGIGRQLGLMEGLIALNTVNLLFGAFVSVQFPYLFGGKRTLTDLGFSYAEYARRGFFELLVVAALTLVLVLALRAHLARATPLAVRLFNLSATATVALVIVLLISAFRRLRLYELTFGFTELRLYGYAGMIWLAVVFVWFVIALWLRPQKVAIGLFVCMLGFVAALNLINPDALVVRFNWQRYTLLSNSLGDMPILTYDNSVSSRIPEPSALDLRYLTSLSNDAVPELLRILPELDGMPRIYLSNALRARGHMLLYESIVVRPPWQSTHLAHLRAARMTQAAFGIDALKAYQPDWSEQNRSQLRRSGLGYWFEYPAELPVVWPASALPVSGAR